MIEVVEYDEAWPALFERLRDAYVAALDSAGVPFVAMGVQAPRGLADALVDTVGADTDAVLGEGVPDHAGARVVGRIGCRRQTGQERAIVTESTAVPAACQP